jgi:hypothetical protein
MLDRSPPVLKPEFVFMDELLREVERGHVRIPAFQRPFVWSTQAMLDLFDSINKGYPIGVLVLWRADVLVPSSDHLGPLELPSPEGGPTSYVIDGSQRLAVLYGTLCLPADFPHDRQEETWRWWIYYDLVSRRFLHLQGGKREPQHMPVRALLKTVDFLKEARWMQEQLGEQQAAVLIEEAESLVQRLKYYKTTVLNIHGGGEQDAMEIFSRLNTGGQRLTADELDEVRGAMRGHARRASRRGQARRGGR